MLWNYEQDGIPWVNTLERLVGNRSRGHVPAPPTLAGFRPAEVSLLRWSREQDVASLPEYALSQSAVAVLPAQQQEEVLKPPPYRTGDHQKTPNSSTAKARVMSRAACAEHQDRCGEPVQVVPARNRAYLAGCEEPRHTGGI